jgi:hypothetical protein
MVLKYVFPKKNKTRHLRVLRGQGLIDTSYKMFDATQCESSGLIPNWAKVYEDGCLGRREHVPGEALWLTR